MNVKCRKNSIWKAIYISISIEDLPNLETFVWDEVRKDISTKDKSWSIIDMVDTNVVSTSFNPHQNKTMIDLLITVADITTDLK